MGGGPSSEVVKPANGEAPVAYVKVEYCGG